MLGRHSTLQLILEKGGGQRSAATPLEMMLRKRENGASDGQLEDNMAPYTAELL